LNNVRAWPQVILILILNFSQFQLTVHGSPYGATRAPYHAPTLRPASLGGRLRSPSFSYFQLLNLSHNHALTRETSRLQEAAQRSVVIIVKTTVIYSTGCSA